MPDSDTAQQLAAFRRSIDNIDAALVHILAERFRITQAVGEYKAANALPPADPARETEQIARLRKLAEESQLDPDPLAQFRAWLAEAVEHQLIEPNAMTLATVDATALAGGCFTVTGGALVCLVRRHRHAPVRAAAR